MAGRYQSIKMIGEENNFEFQRDTYKEFVVTEEQ